MGHRILVRGRTSEGSISGGRGVGALAISGNPGFPLSFLLSFLLVWAYIFRLG